MGSTFGSDTHLSAQLQARASDGFWCVRPNAPVFSVAESLGRVFSRNQKSRAHSAWQGLPMRLVANEAVSLSPPCRSTPRPGSSHLYEVLRVELHAPVFCYGFKVSFDSRG